MTAERVPELKEVVGALIFGAARPIVLRELRRCVKEVGEQYGGDIAAFAEVRERDCQAAVEELRRDLERAHAGFAIVEVANGYRLQSEPCCGRWLKHLLETGKPQRLSRPGLETLAIIACRQPITKGEIEAIRGVNADHMIRSLMELQLVKIAGRSELPGKPFVYGTTHNFLEHFGLKNVEELSSLDPMLTAKELGIAADKKAAEPVLREPDAADPGEPAAGGEPPASGAAEEPGA